MHPEQQIFCLEVKMKFPSWPNPSPFHKAKVLDCGSMDINGTNRFLFSHECEYTGIDCELGRNVTIKSLIHEFDAPDESYDTIICTEVLEHDPHWKESLRNMYRMLKRRGLLIITCATGDRPIHGTADQCPDASPGSHNLFGNYYQNLTKSDLYFLQWAVNLNCSTGAFGEDFEFKIVRDNKDLYFWGLKA